MKNKLIPTLFVLLLTPGLLFAAKPVDETLVKINAVADKLSELEKSVDRPYSSDCYLCARVGPEWQKQLRTTFYNPTTPRDACASYCTANWSDNVDACNQVCEARATGELGDCTPDADASNSDAYAYAAACKYGSFLPQAPVAACQADPQDPRCQSYTNEVIRVLYYIANQYERSLWQGQGHPLIP